MLSRQAQHADDITVITVNHMCYLLDACEHEPLLLDQLLCRIERGRPGFGSACHSQTWKPVV